MAWGRNHEDVAAAAYKFIKQIKTHRCGFYIDPACCWLGASPDRIVNGSSDPGLVEIKCPLLEIDWSLEELAFGLRLPKATARMEGGRRSLICCSIAVTLLTRVTVQVPVKC